MVATIQTLKSAGASAKYYAGYYEQGEYSQWFGAGAKRLGLTGEVKKDDFESVLKGELPDGTKLGRYIAKRDEGGKVIVNPETGKTETQWAHLPGYDLPFCAPKSLSILALIGGDKRLIDAHIRAVVVVMKYMERELCYARNKEGGIEGPVKTKALLTAMFTEFSNRNGEPFIHTHTVHANATHDEEKWRSLWSNAFSKKGMVKYLGKVYRNELAQNIQQLGYGIRSFGNEGLFEIEGINKECIKYFSTRRADIVKWMKDNDIYSSKGSQMANQATKKHKTKHDVVLDKLQPRWQQDIDKCPYTSLAEIKALTQQSIERGDIGVRHSALEKAEIAVAKALAEISIYRDRFDRKELFVKSRGFGIGVDNGLLQHVISQKLESKELVQSNKESLMVGDTFRQTREVLGCVAAQKNIKVLGNFGASVCSVGFNQKAELKKLLTSQSQFVGVDMRDTNNYELVRRFAKGCALGGKQAVTIVPHFMSKELHAAKVAEMGTPVYTVKGFLKYWRENAPTQNQVFILDKGENYRIKDFHAVSKLAFEMDSKVVLAFRPKPNSPCQQAIDSGVPVIGASPDFDFNKTLASLESKLIVEPDRLKMPNRIKEIFKDVDAKAIVMNEGDRALVNQLAREVRLDAGVLGQESVNIKVLNKISLSGIRKMEAAEYQIGHVLCIDKKYQHVTAVIHKDNVLQLRDEDGKGINFNLADANPKKMEVFRPSQLEVRVGDCMRFTKTVNVDGQKRLEGKNVVVNTIGENSIELINKRSGQMFSVALHDLSQQHLSYGYAVPFNKVRGGIEKYQGAVVRRDLDFNQVFDMSQGLSEKGALIVDSKDRLQTKGLDEFSPVELEKYKLNQEQALAKERVYSIMVRSDEREAVQTKQALIAKCMDKGIDIHKDMIVEAIDNCIKKGELVTTTIDNGEEIVASKFTIDQEKLCANLAEQAQGSFEAIMPENHPKLQEILSDKQLTDGQREAVKKILTTSDGIMLVQGLAGTGKTFMMKRVLDGCRAMDVDVIGLAVTGSAVAQLRKELGVNGGGGFETYNVAKFNSMIDSKELTFDKKTLIVPDEGSLVDVVSANKVMLAAQRVNALTAFAGDFKQNTPLGLSNPFEIMLTAKVPTVVMSDLMRFKTQQGADRVAASYAGDLSKVMDNSIVEEVRLTKDEQGNVISNPIAKVAEDYVSIAKDSPNDVVVVTLRNVDKDEINVAIREKLNEAGVLKGDSLSVKALVGRKDLFAEDKEYVQTYVPGNVIKFSGGFKGDIAKNKYCQVVNAENDMLTLKSLSDGRVISWSPNLQENSKNAVEVFHSVDRELQAGDKLVWRGSDQSRGIITGNSFSVVSVDKEKMEFQAKMHNGEIVTLNAKNSANQHWDYAYCKTSFLIQGETIKNIIAYIKAWGGGIHRLQSLLVNGTRGDIFKIIIDDMKKFLEQLQEPMKELATHTAPVFDKKWPEKEACLHSLVAKVTSNHWANQQQANSPLAGEYNFHSKREVLSEYFEASRKSGAMYAEYKKLSSPRIVLESNKALIRHPHTFPYKMVKVAEGLLAGRAHDEIASNMHVKEEVVAQTVASLGMLIVGNKRVDEHFLATLQVAADNHFRVDRIRVGAMQKYIQEERQEAATLKDKAVGWLEIRNLMAHELLAKPEVYEKLLKDKGVDATKLEGQAAKHQEKLDSLVVVTAEHVNKPDISRNEYLATRHRLVSKELGSNANLIDWGTMFRDNLVAGKKIADSSMAVKTMVEKDSKWLEKFDSHISVQMGLGVAKREENDKLVYVEKIVAASQDIPGTQGAKYLSKRGIEVGGLSSDIRFGSVYEPGSKKEKPALICVARNKDDNVQAMQAIYLSGKKKANIDVPKRSYGSISHAGVCVQRGSSNTVVIAEGPETAMSIANADKELTVYAALGSSNLGKIELPTTHAGKRIVIAADNDFGNTVSKRMVDDAVSTWAQKGHDVAVIMPGIIDGKKTDYNDVLQKYGKEEVAKIVDNAKLQAKGINIDSLIDEIKQPFIDKELKIQALAQEEKDRRADELGRERGQSERIGWANDLYDSSASLRGTIGEVYCKQYQHPAESLPENFGFHPSVKHSELGKKIPAIIAPLENSEGSFKGVVKIYLDSDGSKLKGAFADGDGKYAKAQSQMEAGQKTGSFVMINQGINNEKVFLTASIEDGMAITGNCQGNTVIAGLSEKNFKNIELFDETKELVICANRGGVDVHQHIIKSIEHFESRGIHVSVRLPDINDVRESRSFSESLKVDGRNNVEKGLSQNMDVSQGLGSEARVMSDSEIKNISASKQEDRQIQSNMERQQTKQVDFEMVR